MLEDRASGASTTYAKGSQYDLPEATAALFLHNRWATYVSGDLVPNDPVPVGAQVDPLTGGISFSAGGTDMVALGLSKAYAARLTNEHGVKHCGARSTTTFDNYTMQLQTVMPAHFDAVKIVSENIHTSTYNTYFAVAASETLANAEHPVIGGSTKTAAGDWTHVLKSAAEPIQSVLGSANNPSFTVSDWTSLKSVDRTDVAGGLPIVMARAYTAAATGTITRYANIGSFTEGSSTHESNWEALTARVWRVRYKAGDCITTPANFTGASTPNFCSPAFTIMARTRGYGMTVACVGDSIMEGVYANGLSSGYYSFGYQATELVHANDFPCAYLSQGWNGQTGANFYTNAKAVVAAMAPNVMLFPIWSPNDGATQVAFDAAWARAMDMVSFCRQNGVVPVLTTCWPKTGNGALGTEYNAKALALRNAGILVLDVDGVVGSGAVGSRVYLPAYASGDGTHMNAAGHAALAVEFAKILNQIKASSLY